MAGRARASGWAAAMSTSDAPRSGPSWATGRRRRRADIRRAAALSGRGRGLRASSWRSPRAAGPVARRRCRRRRRRRDRAAGCSSPAPLRRRQERAHRRHLPLAAPAGREGGAVQGAEHVQQLGRRGRRATGGAARSAGRRRCRPPRAGWRRTCGSTRCCSSRAATAPARSCCSARRSGTVDAANFRRHAARAGRDRVRRAGASCGPSTTW